MTTQANGHSSILPPPKPELAHNVEIDPKKLGSDGHKLLGEIEALTRWQVMFGAFLDRAFDLGERRTLRAVVDALGDDAERLKVELTQYALRRGAAKVTDNDDEGQA